MIDTCGGEGISGSIGKIQTREPCSTFYVETDDLQATLDKASALGGKTVMPVTDLGGALTTAMLDDLDGLLIGLVQAPAEPNRGMRRFGWKVDTRFPGYVVADNGAGRGIQDGIGWGADARWATVYAGVAGVDQTLSRAENSADGVIARTDGK